MKRGKPEKYLELAGAIRQLGAESRRGDALEPERKLAERFGCSHLTVRKALDVLEQQGLLHTVPSRGSYWGPAPRRNETAGGKLVGFLFPDDETYYYRLFAEFEAELAAMNLYPVVQLTGRAAAKERAILEFLQESGAAAVFAVPNPACRADYAALTIPVVFFDIGLDGLEIPRVLSDDRAGAEAATEYLYRTGHRRIAHVGSLADPTGEERLAGYRAALEKQGIAFDPTLVLRDFPSREWGRRAAEILRGLDAPPSAVFCGNDTIASGVLHGGDFAVVGFGDTPIAEDLDFSSVSQHSDRIAATLAARLRMLTNGDSVPAVTVIPTSLTVRMGGR